MSKSHFPTSCAMPSIVTICPPLQSLERISKNMPLRMPTGRFLDVAGVGFVTFCTKGFAYLLRFLASNQHFHLSKRPYSQIAQLLYKVGGHGLCPKRANPMNRQSQRSHLRFPANSSVVHPAPDRRACCQTCHRRSQPCSP